MDYKKLFAMTKNLSLLLVEDYEPLRDDMSEVLEDLFQTVIVASNGKEALSLYEDFYKKNDKYIDVIISDIQMPIMDGVALCEALYSIRVEQEIIVLSAHSDSKYLIKLINLGIAQFLTKPINNKEFEDILYLVAQKIDAKRDDFSNISFLDLGENCIWDRDKHSLTQNNISINLTKHELLLINLLIKKSNQVCTNDDIIEEFYA